MTFDALYASCQLMMLKCLEGDGNIEGCSLLYAESGHCTLE